MINVIFQRRRQNVILDVLMINVIYSKKTGKCDIGRINDKGDIFKEEWKMRC